MLACAALHHSAGPPRPIRVRSPVSRNLITDRSALNAALWEDRSAGQGSVNVGIK